MAQAYVEGTRRPTGSVVAAALWTAAGAGLLGLTLALWHREGAAIFLDAVLTGLLTCI